MGGGWDVGWYEREPRSNHSSVVLGDEQRKVRAAPHPPPPPPPSRAPRGRAHLGGPGHLGTSSRGWGRGPGEGGATAVRVSCRHPPRPHRPLREVRGRGGMASPPAPRGGEGAGGKLPPVVVVKPP